MAYVITPGCCSDASCVSVCPVNCIHPTPDEPDFGSTATLFVDPATCIDCGACVDACPVDAIGPADLLVGGSDELFVQRNAEFFRDRAAPVALPAPRFPTTVPASVGTLHVAVVGTGPAAYYTADLLLRVVGAEVTMFDRVPVPGGLLRYGVAPDHPATRLLGDRFAGFLHNPRLHLMLGVDVGVDVSADELDAAFDAVVYAVGASAGKALGIPGEQLPGSISATELVAWYNAHPDATHLPVPLDGERAVLIGNGNVALDVARILLGDPHALATTDIADRALDTLRTSSLREVVLVARRGPEHAAYTTGELHALRNLPGVELVIADTPVARAALAAAEPGSRTWQLTDLPVVAVDGAVPTGRRIVLMFGAAPVEFAGSARVDAVRLRIEGEDADVTLSTALAVRAIGYTGRPVPGLPFDAERGIVPNAGGRVRDAAPGTYVVGWIKRGATGGIGANRQDASETVDALIADATDGLLTRRSGSSRLLRTRLRARVGDVVERDGARAIDEAERQRGRAAGRPRVKFASRAELLASARGSA